ncbi:3-oxoacyl-[acyl-carrier-protein] reductase FabG [Gordonia insulae]|uniref:3-oxoacyl-[acyl-carrier-protein] reductase FabG n=1 Tax=Gordonia insulae TaxID=2420509 RepID=A0A3G8JLI3_9ACTN|nr:3-oxoacyl-[acyl-carrier-protein] reductase FabG [Gordonia insulae]
MFSELDVSGKRVVIIGAGRGLGAVLARAFDAAGAHLVLTARDESSLDEVTRVLTRRPVTVVGDVRDATFAEDIADAAQSAHGGIDTWIANAGISPIVADVQSMRSEKWRDIIDVNLTGVFRGVQVAARVLSDGGRIIVTSSVLGDRPRSGLSAYSVSKRAIHALVETLAQEVGDRSITVNAVALGWFDAGLGALWSDDRSRGDEVIDHSALKRLGTAADLPGAFLFLASDAAAFVTGTTITVDGGYSLL